MGRIAGRFARHEPRLRAGRLVQGLLSDLARKNCWTIAEWAGESAPHGMQHLLCRATWDADAVRDDVREYVVEHLYDEAAVLVADETGDLKKGTHAVGVQRQYTGHSRADRELPGRRLPCLHRRAGTRRGGPGAVPPALLDVRPVTLPGRRARRGHRLRDQAGTGQNDRVEDYARTLGYSARTLTRATLAADGVTARSSSTAASCWRPSGCSPTASRARLASPPSSDSRVRPTSASSSIGTPARAHWPFAGRSEAPRTEPGQATGPIRWKAPLDGLPQLVAGIRG